MENLTPQHWAELEASGISPEIAQKYFYSTQGEAAQGFLIDEAVRNLGTHSRQYVTAPYQRLIEKSEHVKAGGWICSANGQLKPDEPRQAIAKNKDTGEYEPVFKADGTPKFIKYDSIREKPYRGQYVELMQPEGEPIKAADGSRLIVVTEGGKKAAALATAGFEAIGLPGVDMGSYTEGCIKGNLIGVLQDAVNDGATLVIAFDQDTAKRTRQGVANSAARLVTHIEDAGGAVLVAAWKPKHGKGADDVLVKSGADFLRSAIAAAKEPKAWLDSLPRAFVSRPRSTAYKLELERIKALHQQYLAKPKADITLNQRYLDKGQLPAPGSVLLLDSQMGTGKTSQALAGIVEQHRDEHPEAVAVISAYRNILLRQMGQNLGFTHWLDTDGDPSLAKHKRLMAVPDSLAKLSHQHFPPGSLLLIDEVVAWLRYVYTSDTMKNGADRVAALIAIQTILTKVIDGGGFVVGCEANIPQWALDCLRELLPAGTPISFVRNEFKLQANQKAFFYDKMLSLKTAQQTMHLKGVKIVAPSDAANQIDMQYRKMFDGPKCLHISRENSATEEAQDFASNPQGDLIKRDGLDLLSYSPTLGAGSSIDDAPGREPWFDVKTGIFTHLTSGDAAQQLARYRRDVPLHIYCKESGQGVGPNDLTVFTPEGLLKRWHEDAAYCNGLTGMASHLSQDGESLNLTMARSLTGDIPEVANLEKWRSIVTAIDNFDKLHLRENLKAKLTADGYECVGMTTDTIPGKAEEFKELKAEAESDRGAEFAALMVPDDLTPDEARTILSSHGHTRQQSLQAKKCLYQFEFPGCDFDNAKFCTDWLIKNKGKKLSQLRDEWRARNPEAAKAIDRWHLKGKLKQAHSLGTGVSVADVSKKSPAADLFAKAKLPEAIDAIGTEIYGNAHPEVVRVAAWTKENKPVLESVLRMRFDDEKSSDLALFNSLARKLGYAPQKEKQSGADGKRERLYVLSDFCNPDRGHMLKSLSDKFMAKLEQKGEQLDGKRLSGTPDWGVSSEELAERQASEPVAMPATAKPAQAPIQTLEPKLYMSDKSGSLLDCYFEEELCKAETYQALLDAKAKASEGTQRRVMAVWEKDGRRDVLIAKRDRLMAEAGGQS